MARTDPQFPLRLPGDLRDRVKAAAETSRRSMNSEIVFHLERALREGDTTATGLSPEKAIPVAADRTAALPGSDPHHQGL